MVDQKKKKVVKILENFLKIRPPPLEKILDPPLVVICFQINLALLSNNFPDYFNYFWHAENVFGVYILFSCIHSVIESILRL